MEEHDPTAVEPDDIAEPSEPIEDQTPPLEYEPQIDTQTGGAGIEEREPDLVTEADEQLPNVGDDTDEGDAEGGDDDAEDPDQDDN